MPAVRPCGLSQLFNLASVYYPPCSWVALLPTVVRDTEGTGGGDGGESWADPRGLFLFGCVSELCDDQEARGKTFNTV